jgi:S1-C subfamily serine protease
MPGDFDFFDDDPKAPPPPPPRARAADEAPSPSRPRPSGRRSLDTPDPRKGVSRPLLAGIAIGALLVLVAGVVVVVLVSGPSKSTEPKDKGNTTTATTKPPPPPKKEKDPVDQTAPAPEVVARVKKATVRILVEKPGKKGISSGSGFVEKETRMVLTNAHVVGMKSISDREPVINLIVNSGGDGGEEYRLDGEVVAVDAENDLAVIRPLLLEVGKRTPVPEGLVVPKTSNVTELQRLFVFGFPLGDALGPEISVRPTQVTSLRHEAGKPRIQVEGGMTFGNSGGPVVDVKGNVVGVAVSGILNANINFCVPAEMVQQILTRKSAWKKD